MRAIPALYRPGAVPIEHRSIFRFLILDMAWFGILSGSAIAFVAIYAARLGASTFEISLLNASPAITNLLLALPAGYWVQKRPLGRTVFVTSVLHRMFYLPWIVMPWLLSSSGQVWLAAS